MSKLEKMQKELAEYWGTRAPSYSEENQRDFTERVTKAWTREIERHIRKAFPGKEPSRIRFLEIAPGPGTFSIMMARAGYSVTAIDLAPGMIEQAKENAGDLADMIDFRVMNAEETAFEDGSFDVIFSRWLTWLLPRPEKAYCEWLRILSDDGIILIYDGNNSRHFYDKQAEEEYKKQERQLTYKDKDGHLLPQEFYEKLDENVKNIAMTYIVRPYWDRCIFNAYGAEVYVDEKVMETIIPDFVNGNTATMEVFLVKAGKKAIL